MKESFLNCKLILSIVKVFHATLTLPATVVSAQTKRSFDAQERLTPEHPQSSAALHIRLCLKCQIQGEYGVRK